MGLAQAVRSIRFMVSGLPTRSSGTAGRRLSSPSYSSSHTALFATAREASERAPGPPREDGPGGQVLRFLLLAQGCSLLLDNAEYLLCVLRQLPSGFLHQFARNTPRFLRSACSFLCRLLQLFHSGKSLPEFLQARTQLTTPFLIPHQCYRQGNHHA